MQDCSELVLQFDDVTAWWWCDPGGLLASCILCGFAFVFRGPCLHHYEGMELATPGRRVPSRSSVEHDLPSGLIALLGQFCNVQA